MNNLKDLTVGTKQLAEIFGVSDSYISDLVNDHGMPKLGFNKFPLIDCIKFRINHLEKMNEEKLNRYRDLTNRGRLEAAQAKLKELELAEKENLLGPIAEFELAMKNEIQILKKGLEAFSKTLKYDLHLNPEQIKIIEIEANRILTQLSELRPDILAVDVNFNKIDLT